MIDRVNHAQAGDAVTKPAFKRAMEPFDVRMPGRGFFEGCEATVEKALGFGGGPLVKPPSLWGEANLKHAGADGASAR